MTYRNQPDVPFKRIEGRVMENTSFMGDPEKVSPDFDEKHAIARPKFTVEWGTRKTDGALVIHLYPHIEGNNVAKDWDESYAMDKRLDYAVAQAFDVKKVNAGFEPSFNSFYIIVHHLIVPDLRLLVQRFLEKIEGAPAPR